MHETLTCIAAQKLQFQHPVNFSGAYQNYRTQQEIIRSRDYDMMLGALPTKASNYAKLTTPHCLRNEPKIKIVAQ